MSHIPPEYIRIAMTRNDGMLVIMCFITKQQRNGVDPGWKREPTVENITAEIKKSQGDKITSWRIVDISEIPGHLVFRSAWKDMGKSIEHDMDKVRAICVDRLRQARAPQLDQLDREWMKAMGQGDKKIAAAVEEQRQALRDAPAAMAEVLKSATTAEVAIEVCRTFGVPLE